MSDTHYIVDCIVNTVRRPYHRLQTAKHAGGAAMMQQSLDTSGMLSRGTLRRALPPDRRSSDPFRANAGAGSDLDINTGGSAVRPGGRQRPHRPHHGSMGLGAALRRFWRGEHGAVAIESAIAMVILVVGFAGLMEIMQASYADDRMARAARAAARVLALNPGADACSAIRRELDLAKDFECEPGWTLNVELGVSPNSLSATLGDSAAAGTGDMVLVRIGWNRKAFSFGGDGHEADDSEDTEDDAAEIGGDGHEADDSEDTEDDAAEIVTVPMVAIGLARCELELCGRSTT